MVDVRRFRNILIVGGWLALFVASFNFMLLAILGPAPAWLVPLQIPLPWGFVEKAEARIEGLRAASKTNGPAQKPFLVYFGMSTAREGIDPEILRANDGIDAIPVGICGTGGGMDHLPLLVEPFVRSGAKPSLALLCMHPFFLVGKPTPQLPPSLDPLPALRQGDWREALRLTGWWDWLSSNRMYVHHRVRTAWHDARLKLGATPADADPWRAPERLGYPQHVDEETLREQFAGFKSRGWFDPEQYARHQELYATTLAEVITQLWELDCDVYIILMPERETVRNRVPPEARQFLITTLQKRFADRPPPILQFQNAIPDTMFCDAGHLNDTGRREFSALLGKALKARRAR